MLLTFLCEKEIVPIVRLSTSAESLRRPKCGCEHSYGGGRCVSATVTAMCVTIVVCIYIDLDGGNASPVITKMFKPIDLFLYIISHFRAK